MAPTSSEGHALARRCGNIVSRISGVRWSPRFLQKVLRESPGVRAILASLSERRRRPPKRLRDRDSRRGLLRRQRLEVLGHDLTLPGVFPLVSHERETDILFTKLRTVQFYNVAKNRAISFDRG